MTTLRRAIAGDRVGHAYLVAGPDGIGKASLARAFAQALCCQAPPGSTERPTPDVSCGVCSVCRRIGRGVHPDVQTFDLSTQAVRAEKAGTKNTALTIETVRELAAATALRPMETKRRLIVVDDAETMQGVAQEALLKTLEEPAPTVTLVLLADDAEALLPTVRSRCQLVELRPLPRGLIVTALEAAGGKAETATEIASVAGGRLGWALRAASDPKLLRERREAVERALTWIGGSPYDRLVAAVRLGDGFSKRRSEVFVDLETVLGVWRDALLLRAGLPEHLSFRTDADRLSELTAAWDLNALRRAIGAVQACLGDLEANVRPRLAIEAMVLQWPTTSRRP